MSLYWMQLSFSLFCEVLGLVYGNTTCNIKNVRSAKSHILLSTSMSKACAPIYTLNANQPLWFKFLAMI